jgi:hypothetical protein
VCWPGVANLIAKIKRYNNLGAISLIPDCCQEAGDACQSSWSLCWFSTELTGGFGVGKEGRGRHGKPRAILSAKASGASWWWRNVFEVTRKQGCVTGFLWQLRKNKQTLHTNILTPLPPMHVFQGERRSNCVEKLFLFGGGGQSIQNLDQFIKKDWCKS